MDQDSTWVDQTFTTSRHLITLGDKGIRIEYRTGETFILLIPIDRHEANQLSIALKKAANRCEAIGKGLR